MKFSIFMMPLHHPTENPSLAFDRDIALIQYADELGYDEFFIGEHHSGGWETMPAPEMALAKASARALLIRLGTLVSSAPLDPPVCFGKRMPSLAVRFYGDCLDQTDAFLVEIAMQVVGFRLDVISDQQVYTQDG